MRQFDVFVFDENYDEAQGKLPQPPFTDPELGWFFTSDWNKHLDEIEGEWVIFAHPSIKINRNFLNNVAEVTDSFPMVDAFAPRIRTDKGKFLGGYLLKPAAKGSGFVEIDENAPLRYVAAPHPFLAVFSRRIIQRTGGFDTTLPEYARLADFTLRMMHAGGKMFSVPYLVARFNPEASVPDTANVYENADDLALALVKAFGYWKNRKFLLHHAGTLRTLWNKRKELENKRDKAILLSKLDKKFLTDLA